MKKQQKQRRIGIFYFSRIEGAGRQPIALPGGGRAFVRVVEVRGADPSEALDMAAPDGGESVMNTHELDVA